MNRDRERRELAGEATRRDLMEKAAAFGTAAARKFFSKRSSGKNVEVHLCERELADLFAFGWEMGAKGKRAPHCNNGPHCLAPESCICLCSACRP